MKRRGATKVRQQATEADPEFDLPWNWTATTKAVKAGARACGWHMGVGKEAQARMTDAQGQRRRQTQVQDSTSPQHLGRGTPIGPQAH